MRFFCVVLIAFASAFLDNLDNLLGGGDFDCSICPNDKFNSDVVLSYTCQFPQTSLGSEETCDFYVLRDKTFVDGATGEGVATCKTDNQIMSESECEATATGAEMTSTGCEASAVLMQGFMSLGDAACDSEGWTAQQNMFAANGCCADKSVKSLDCTKDWCDNKWQDNGIAMSGCTFSGKKLPYGETCEEYNINGRSFEKREESYDFCNLERQENLFTKEECEAVMEGASFYTRGCGEWMSSYEMIYQTQSMSCGDKFEGTNYGAEIMFGTSACCTGGKAKKPEDCICGDVKGDFVSLATGSGQCQDTQTGETMETNEGNDMDMSNGFTEAQCTQLQGDWNTLTCGYYAAWLAADPTVCAHGSIFSSFCCGVDAPVVEMPTVPAAGGLGVLYYYADSNCKGNPIMIHMESFDALDTCTEDDTNTWAKLTIGDDCDSYTMNYYDNSDCTGTPVESESGKETDCILQEDSSSASQDSDEEGPQLYRKIDVTAGSDADCSANDEAPQLEFKDDSASFISLAFLVFLPAFLNL